MAGEIETQAHGEVNGTEAEQPGSAKTERASLTKAEQDAADRAAFLSGAWDDDEVAAAPAKPAKKAAAKPVAELEDDEEEDADRDDDERDADEDLEDVIDDEDDIEEEDERSAAKDEDDDEEKAPDAKGDAEMAKRLAKVQKFEKKVRDQAAERDRQFAKERDEFLAEWKPKMEAYEAFEKLKSRKSSPEAILKAVGYSEDDFEELSKIIWGLSKTGSADPKNKEAVARLQANRELRDQNEALQKRLDSIEGKLTQKEKEAESNRRYEQYMGRVEKSVSDETPLVKKRLELAPKSTRHMLVKVAHKLAEKHGSLADPKKVARAYEQRLVRERDLAAKLAGDEAAAPTKGGAKPAKKATIEVVDKSKKSPTPKNGSSNGSTIPSREEMIDRLRRIDRGELDPDHD